MASAMFALLVALCASQVLSSSLLHIDTDDHDTCSSAKRDVDRDIDLLVDLAAEVQGANGVLQFQPEGEVSVGEVALPTYPELDLSVSDLGRLEAAALEKEAELLDLEERPSPVHLKHAVVVNAKNKIGEGAYKIVFKEVINGVKRAVSRIPLANYDDVKKEWLLQEAIASVRINGISSCKDLVPRVIGVKHSNGYVFIVSELAAGDLDTYAEGGKTPAFDKWLDNIAKSDTSRLTGLVEMAIGLKCVKGAGLVHRDVKPPNFLVSDTAPNHILVNDFGLSIKSCKNLGTVGADGLDDCAAENEISMFCCTEEDRDAITGFNGREYFYWPSGRVLSTLGPSLDVYSLGITFKEMLDYEPRFLSSFRSELNTLITDMTTRPYITIEQVIARLLVILRTKNAGAAGQILDMVTNLQAEVSGYLDGIADNQRNVDNLQGQISAIKNKSIFNKFRWSRWCFNREDYEAVEILKRDMRARLARIQELKRTLETLI